MRVLMVCPEFPPQTGGMESSAVGLARYLVNHGDDVQVLTRTCKELRVSWREAEEADRALNLPTERCIEVHDSIWHAANAVQRRAKRFRPDVAWFSGVGWAALAPLLDAPAVSRSVGNDVTRPWVGARREALVTGANVATRLRLGWLIRRAAKHWSKDFVKLAEFGLLTCNAYIANSDYTRGRLLEHGVSPGKVRIVRGGVADAFFNVPGEARAVVRKELGISPSDVVFLSACRLMENKGIDDAIRATARVRVSRTNAVYLILGDGRARAALEKLSERLGLCRSVRFLGQQPPENVARHMRAADVFLMPSKEETMGRSACEAAACGLAVIGARTGGLGEVVKDGETGIMATAGDVNDLAAAMSRLADDGDLRRRLGENGRRLAVEAFGWKSVGAAMRDALVAARDEGVPPGRDAMRRRFSRLAGAPPSACVEVFETSESDPSAGRLTVEPGSERFHCRVWLNRPDDGSLSRRLSLFGGYRSLSVAIDPSVELGGSWTSPGTGAFLFDPQARRLIRTAIEARRHLRGVGRVWLHVGGRASRPLYMMALEHALALPGHFA